MQSAGATKPLRTTQCLTVPKVIYKLCRSTVFTAGSMLNVAHHLLCSRGPNMFLVTFRVYMCVAEDENVAHRSFCVAEEITVAQNLLCAHPT